jgi:hypothetical protein
MRFTSLSLVFLLSYSVANVGVFAQPPGQANRPPPPGQANRPLDGLPPWQAKPPPPSLPPQARAPEKIPPHANAAVTKDLEAVQVGVNTLLVKLESPTAAPTAAPTTSPTTAPTHPHPRQLPRQLKR